MAQEAPTMEKCLYCDKEKNVRGMGLHVFKIHPEKIDEYRKTHATQRRVFTDDELEKCPYCEKKTNVKGMNLHVFHKHPEKLVEFKQQQSLPPKTPRTLEEFPYQCPECPEIKTKNRGHLKLHVRRKHPEKVEAYMEIIDRTVEKPKTIQRAEDLKESKDSRGKVDNKAEENREKKIDEREEENREKKIDEREEENREKKIDEREEENREKKIDEREEENREKKIAEREEENREKIDEREEENGEKIDEKEDDNREKKTDKKEEENRDKEIDKKDEDSREEQIEKRKEAENREGKSDKKEEKELEQPDSKKRDVNTNDNEHLIKVVKEVKSVTKKPVKRKSSTEETDESPAPSDVETGQRKTRSQSDPSVSVNESRRIRRVISVGSPVRSPARSPARLIDDNVRMPNGVNLKEFSVTMTKMSKKDISEQSRQKRPEPKVEEEEDSDAYTGETDSEASSAPEESTPGKDVPSARRPKRKPSTRGVVANYAAFYMSDSESESIAAKGNTKRAGDRASPRRGTRRFSVESAESTTTSRSISTSRRNSTESTESEVRASRKSRPRTRRTKSTEQRTQQSKVPKVVTSLDDLDCTYTDLDSNIPLVNSPRVITSLEDLECDYGQPPAEKKASRSSSSSSESEEEVVQRNKMRRVSWPAVHEPKPQKVAPQKTPQALREKVDEVIKKITSPKPEQKKYANVSIAKLQQRAAKKERLIEKLMKEPLQIDITSEKVDEVKADLVRKTPRVTSPTALNRMKKRPTSSLSPEEMAQSAGKKAPSAALVRKRSSTHSRESVGGDGAIEESDSSTDSEVGEKSGAEEFTDWVKQMEIIVAEKRDTAQTCGVCGETFSSRRVFSKHRATCKEEQAPPPCKEDVCDVCGDVLNGSMKDHEEECPGYKAEEQLEEEHDLKSAEAKQTGEDKDQPRGGGNVRNEHEEQKGNEIKESVPDRNEEDTKKAEDEEEEYDGEEDDENEIERNRVLSSLCNSNVKPIDQLKIYFQNRKERERNMSGDAIRLNRQRDIVLVRRMKELEKEEAEAKGQSEAVKQKCSETIQKQKQADQSDKSKDSPKKNTLSLDTKKAEDSAKKKTTGDNIESRRKSRKPKDESEEKSPSNDKDQRTRSVESKNKSNKSTSSDKPKRKSRSQSTDAKSTKRRESHSDSPARKKFKADEKAADSNLEKDSKASSPDSKTNSKDKRDNRLKDTQTEIMSSSASQSKPTDRKDSKSTTGAKMADSKSTPTSTAVKTPITSSNASSSYSSKQNLSLGSSHSQNSSLNSSASQLPQATVSRPAYKLTAISPTAPAPLRLPSVAPSQPGLQKPASGWNPAVQQQQPGPKPIKIQQKYSRARRLPYLRLTFLHCSACLVQFNNTEEFASHVKQRNMGGRAAAAGGRRCEATCVLLKIVWKCAACGCGFEHEAECAERHLDLRQCPSLSHQAQVVPQLLQPPQQQPPQWQQPQQLVNPNAQLVQPQQVPARQGKQPQPKAQQREAQATKKDEPKRAWKLMKVETADKKPAERGGNAPTVQATRSSAGKNANSPVEASAQWQDVPKPTRIVEDLHVASSEQCHRDELKEIPKCKATVVLMDGPIATSSPVVQPPSFKDISNKTSPLAPKQISQADSLASSQEDSVSTFDEPILPGLTLLEDRVKIGQEKVSEAKTKDEKPMDVSSSKPLESTVSNSSTTAVKDSTISAGVQDSIVAEVQQDSPVTEEKDTVDKVQQKTDIETFHHAVNPTSVVQESAVQEESQKESPNAPDMILPSSKEASPVVDSRESSPGIVSPLAGCARATAAVFTDDSVVIDQKQLSDATDPTEHEKQPDTETTDPTEHESQPETETTDPTEHEKQPETETTDTTEHEKQPETETTDTTEHEKQPETETTDPTEHEKQPETKTRTRTDLETESSQREQETGTFEVSESPETEPTMEAKVQDSSVGNFTSEKRLTRSSSRLKDEKSTKRKDVSAPVEEMTTCSASEETNYTSAKQVESFAEIRECSVVDEESVQSFAENDAIERSCEMDTECELESPSKVLAEQPNVLVAETVGETAMSSIQNASELEESPDKVASENTSCGEPSFFEGFTVIDEVVSEQESFTIQEDEDEQDVKEESSQESDCTNLTGSKLKEAEKLPSVSPASSLTVLPPILPTSFVCKRCKSSFTSQEVLDYHEENTCAKYVCMNCEKVYRYEDLLIMHRRKCVAASQKKLKESRPKRSKSSKSEKDTHKSERRSRSRSRSISRSSGRHRSRSSDKQLRSRSSCSRSRSGREESKSHNKWNRRSSGENRKLRSKERHRSRSKSRDRYRSRSRERRQSRSRERRQSRSRERRRSRSRERRQSRSREKRQSRSRERHQSRSREKRQSRSRERRQSRSRERRRSRSRERRRRSRSRNRRRSNDMKYTAQSRSTDRSPLRKDRVTRSNERSTRRSDQRRQRRSSKSRSKSRPRSSNRCRKSKSRDRSSDHSRDRLRSGRRSADLRERQNSGRSTRSSDSTDKKGKSSDEPRKEKKASGSSSENDKQTDDSCISSLPDSKDQLRMKTLQLKVKKLEEVSTKVSRQADYSIPERSLRSRRSIVELKPQGEKSKCEERSAKKESVSRESSPQKRRTRSTSKPVSEKPEELSKAIVSYTESESEESEPAVERRVTRSIVHRSEPEDVQNLNKSIVSYAESDSEESSEPIPEKRQTRSCVNRLEADNVRECSLEKRQTRSASHAQPEPREPSPDKKQSRAATRLSESDSVGDTKQKIQTRSSDQTQSKSSQESNDLRKRTAKCSASPRKSGIVEELNESSNENIVLNTDESHMLVFEKRQTRSSGKEPEPVLTSESTKSDEKMEKRLTRSLAVSQQEDVEENNSSSPQNRLPTSETCTVEPDNVQDLSPKQKETSSATIWQESKNCQETEPEQMSIESMEEETIDSTVEEPVETNREMGKRQRREDSPVIGATEFSNASLQEEHHGEDSDKMDDVRVDDAVLQESVDEDVASNEYKEVSTDATSREELNQSDSTDAPIEDEPEIRAKSDEASSERKEEETENATFEESKEVAFKSESRELSEEQERMALAESCAENMEGSTKEDDAIEEMPIENPSIENESHYNRKMLVEPKPEEIDDLAVEKPKEALILTKIPSQKISEESDEKDEGKSVCHNQEMVAVRSSEESEVTNMRSTEDSSEKPDKDLDCQNEKTPASMDQKIKVALSGDSIGTKVSSEKAANIEHSHQDLDSEDANTNKGVAPEPFEQEVANNKGAVDQKARKQDDPSKDLDEVKSRSPSVDKSHSEASIVGSEQRRTRSRTRRDSAESTHSCVSVESRASLESSESRTTRNSRQPTPVKQPTGMKPKRQTRSSSHIQAKTSQESNDPRKRTARCSASPRKSGIAQELNESSSENMELDTDESPKLVFEKRQTRSSGKEPEPVLTSVSTKSDEKMEKRLTRSFAGSQQEYVEENELSSPQKGLPTSEVSAIEPDKVEVSFPKQKATQSTVLSVVEKETSSAMSRQMSDNYEETNPEQKPFVSKKEIKDDSVAEPVETNRETGKRQRREDSPVVGATEVSNASIQEHQGEDSDKMDVVRVDDAVEPSKSLEKDQAVLQESVDEDEANEYKEGSTDDTSREELNQSDSTDAPIEDEPEIRAKSDEASVEPKEEETEDTTFEESKEVAFISESRELCEEQERMALAESCAENMEGSTKEDNAIEEMPIEKPSIENESHYNRKMLVEPKPKEIDDLAVEKPKEALILTKIPSQKVSEESDEKDEGKSVCQNQEMAVRSSEESEVTNMRSTEDSSEKPDKDLDCQNEKTPASMDQKIKVALSGNSIGTKVSSEKAANIEHSHQDLDSEDANTNKGVAPEPFEQEVANNKGAVDQKARKQDDPSKDFGEVKSRSPSVDKSHSEASIVGSEQRRTRSRTRRDSAESTHSCVSVESRASLESSESRTTRNSRQPTPVKQPKRKRDASTPKSSSPTDSAKHKEVVTRSGRKCKPSQIKRLIEEEAALKEAKKKEESKNANLKKKKEEIIDSIENDKNKEETINKDVEVNHDCRSVSGNLATISQNYSTDDDFEDDTNTKHGEQNSREEECSENDSFIESNSRNCSSSQDLPKEILKEAETSIAPPVVVSPQEHIASTESHEMTPPTTESEIGAEQVNTKPVLNIGKEKNQGKNTNTKNQGKGNRIDRPVKRPAFSMEEEPPAKLPKTLKEPTICHTPKGPMFMCPECNTSFKDRFVLQHHQQCVHSSKTSPTPETSKLSCGICKPNVSFDDELAMQFHLKWKHGVRNPFSIGNLTVQGQKASAVIVTGVVPVASAHLSPKSECTQSVDRSASSPSSHTEERTPFPDSQHGRLTPNQISEIFTSKPQAPSDEGGDNILPITPRKVMKTYSRKLPDNAFKKLLMWPVKKKSPENWPSSTASATAVTSATAVSVTSTTQANLSTVFTTSTATTAAITPATVSLSKTTDVPLARQSATKTTDVPVARQSTTKITDVPLAKQSTITTDAPLARTTSPTSVLAATTTSTMKFSATTGEKPCPTIPLATKGVKSAIFRYRCTECKAMFATHNECQRHTAIHLKKKVQDNSTQRPSTPVAATSSKVVTSKGRSGWMCSLCRVTLPSFEQYGIHMQQTHNKSISNTTPFKIKGIGYSHIPKDQGPVYSTVLGDASKGNTVVVQNRIGNKSPAPAGTILTTEALYKSSQGTGVYSSSKTGTFYHQITPKANTAQNVQTHPSNSYKTSVLTPKRFSSSAVPVNYLKKNAATASGPSKVLTNRAMVKTSPETAELLPGKSVVMGRSETPATSVANQVSTAAMSSTPEASESNLGSTLPMKGQEKVFLKASRPPCYQPLTSLVQTPIPSPPVLVQTPLHVLTSIPGKTPVQMVYQQSPGSSISPGRAQLITTNMSSGGNYILQCPTSQMSLSSSPDPLPQYVQVSTPPKHAQMGPLLQEIAKSEVTANPEPEKVADTQVTQQPPFSAPPSVPSDVGEGPSAEEEPVVSSSTATTHSPPPPSSKVQQAADKPTTKPKTKKEKTKTPKRNPQSKAKKDNGNVERKKDRKEPKPKGSSTSKDGAKPAISSSNSTTQSPAPRSRKALQAAGKQTTKPKPVKEKGKTKTPKRNSQPKAKKDDKDIERKKDKKESKSKGSASSKTIGSKRKREEEETPRKRRK